MSPRSLGSRSWAILLGLLASLALLEVGARLLEPASPGAALAGDIGERIPDDVLEYRTAPSTGENDARGYRNSESLEHADLVALGDSQTWGVNAGRDATWPAVLAETSGKTVYNMGRGGYGAIQYRHQLEEALTLEPGWIVVALYFGNDIYDAYALAYAQDAHAPLRHPDPAVRSEIESSQYPNLQRMFFERLAYANSGSWSTEHSALVRMILRVASSPADPAADRAWAADHPAEGFAFDGPVPTVFHTAYRLAAVDTSLDRVREGLRITLDVLGEIATRIEREPETRLLVVLLPTKERIYARAVSSAGVSTPWSYVQSVSGETRIAMELTALLEERGVPTLDLLPAMEASLARGEAIFPPNADGHFTEVGYRVIAEQVAASVE